MSHPEPLAHHHRHMIDLSHIDVSLIDGWEESSGWPREERRHGGEIWMEGVGVKEEERRRPYSLLTLASLRLFCGGRGEWPPPEQHASFIVETTPDDSGAPSQTAHLQETGRQNKSRKNITRLRCVPSVNALTLKESGVMFLDWLHWHQLFQYH